MTLPRSPRMMVFFLLLGFLGGGGTDTLGESSVGTPPARGDRVGGSNGSAPSKQPLLRPYRAEYQLTWHSLPVGRLKVDLVLRKDGSYCFTGESLPLGLLAQLRQDTIHEVTEGRIDQGRVVPLRYEYHHRQTDHPRDVVIEFDWEHAEARNRINGAEWRMSLSPGSQDKLSQQLALMAALNGGAIREYRFPVADGGKLKEYRFIPAGSERLEPILGGVETLKLIRQKGDQPSNMTLWVAPSHHHLPVRFERDEEDEQLLAELVDLRWGG
jgi:hypothetical protein